MQGIFEATNSSAKCFSVNGENNERIAAVSINTSLMYIFVHELR